MKSPLQLWAQRIDFSLYGGMGINPYKYTKIFLLFYNFKVKIYSD